MINRNNQLTCPFSHRRARLCPHGDRTQQTGKKHILKIYSDPRQKPLFSAMILNIDDYDLNTVSSFQLEHYEHLQVDREIRWTWHFNCSWPTNVGKQGTSNLQFLLQKSFFLWYHCCVCVWVVCCLCCVSTTLLCVAKKCSNLTWQLDIGGTSKVPGITSTLPSNGTSGGGLHSGPEKNWGWGWGWGCAVDKEYLKRKLFSKIVMLRFEPPLTQFGHSSSSGTRK